MSLESELPPLLSTHRQSSVQSNEAKWPTIDIKIDENPKEGQKCSGCRRFYKDGNYSFKEVVHQLNSEGKPVYRANSSMKSPLRASTDPKKCVLCADEWKRQEVCCKSSSGRSFTCLCCRNNDNRETYWPGPRNRNPIWSGDDCAQIGIFIRGFRVKGVDEQNKTISVRYFLNIVWLDTGFCEYVKSEKKKSEDQKISDEQEDKKIPVKQKDTWWKQLSVDEYEKLYEKYLQQPGNNDQKEKYYGESMKESQYRKPEIEYNTLPNVSIWNEWKDSYTEKQNYVSLCKDHIGKGTVYWRRLINVTLECDFLSKSYPFGYEAFEMELRLLSWTKQHFVLFRTNAWFDAHFQQLKHSNQTALLPDHAFSYCCPDDERISQWNVCSVHNKRDKWYSKFDNNDLTIRLPVKVTRGQDNTSSFKALIILKRRPNYVLWNRWFWFSLTTFLSVMTYRLHPLEYWEGRLAIAVAVIFVQMNLWINKGNPRMAHYTMLDYHMFMCIVFVVLQAFVQCFVAWVAESSNNIVDLDCQVGWVNFALICLMNVSTFGVAKKLHLWERMYVEEKVRGYTGFNKEPLGDYEKGQIGNEVAIKSVNHQADKVQTYNIIVDDLEKGKKVLSDSRTSSCCSCCFRPQHYIRRTRTFYTTMNIFKNIPQ